EEQRLELEERLFTDTEAFELLEALEDELVQDYVAGDLPCGERKLLEKQWASMPRMQARLEFARSLRKEALGAHPHPSWRSRIFPVPKWRLAAAVCAAALLMVVAIRWSQTVRAPRETARVPVATPAQPSTAPRVFALVLTPGLSRAPGSGGTHDVPRDAT